MSVVFQMSVSLRRWVWSLYCGSFQTCPPTFFRHIQRFVFLSKNCSFKNVVLQSIESQNKTFLKAIFSQAMYFELSSHVFCFLLIILPFPDMKRACSLIDVIKDIILRKCVRNNITFWFEEVHVHWQRTFTRTSLWKMHWSYKSNFLKHRILTALVYNEMVIHMHDK